ncbi:MAG: ATP-dependent protease ATPase subunit HslU [Candidatus Eisenbacteria bacterium]|uniref:ATP-dependent protease ATPase subunit HslU n=1 Tax=Eiseniibacteriota bacterium TaxID=2212470 RepID=A0A937XBC1_UNCEI|nr:ATP-dependent protease ATPase subunit HslU [Candidatus Eisenbacteria bacterium]
MPVEQAAARRERPPATAGIPELTPSQIVRQLDRYIVGQTEAKRCVAIALRNRYRRRLVGSAIRDEILPNNIIMIGPTGVGKTEIARRLARLAGAPFLKVEATKFTEVGYVGRDVESLVRDLVEIGVNMVREEMAARVAAQARRHVERRLLALLLPPRARRHARPPDAVAPSLFGAACGEGDDDGGGGDAREAHGGEPLAECRREPLRRQLREGLLEDHEVEIDIEADPSPALFEPASPSALGAMERDLPEHLQALLPTGRRRRKMTLGEARRLLLQRETGKLVDMDKVVEVALERVQHSGIVFIDEIDKIAFPGAGAGPEVSRRGVQRDLLPVIEGCRVATRYGLVKTDYILFIAAGSFHACKPADLIPELQGRFPIRVELAALGERDLARILTEPENALLKQYAALLATEGVALRFSGDAVTEIAAIAARINEQSESIGARRLHTVLTTLLEEILFEVPEACLGEIRVDAAMVRRRLHNVLEDADLSRYIL